MLKLYDYWRSSAAYRVRIALNLKGLPYESVPINLLPGQDEQLREPYRAKNPQMRVPGLETERGVLTQSFAILEWLDRNYPEPPLVPADPWEAAQVRAFALTIGTDIHPVNNLSTVQRIRFEFGASEEHIREWTRHWIKLGFSALLASPTFCSCRKCTTRAASRPISQLSRVLSRGTNVRASIRLSSKPSLRIRRTP